MHFNYTFKKERITENKNTKTQVTSRCTSRAGNCRAIAVAAQIEGKRKHPAEIDGLSFFDVAGQSRKHAVAARSVSAKAVDSEG